MGDNEAIQSARHLAILQLKRSGGADWLDKQRAQESRSPTPPTKKVAPPKRRSRPKRKKTS